MEIPRSVLDAIRRQLVTAYPDEGCGFLVGYRGSDGEVTVRHRLPMENHRLRDGAATNRYLIASDDFRAAERKWRAAGLEIVGTYHSHPDTVARPSAYDREQAWPWLQYLIVSVVRGTLQDERVWELTDDRTQFVEHALRVKEL